MRLRHGELISAAQSNGCQLRVLEHLEGQLENLEEGERKAYALAYYRSRALLQTSALGRKLHLQSDSF